MVWLLATLSKDQAWDIVIGLWTLAFLLPVMGQLLVTVLLLQVAWRGYKQLRSPHRPQRRLGLARLVVGAGVPLCFAGSLLGQWREQERVAIEHQAVERRQLREDAQARRQATHKKEQQDSLYFSQMEAGKVDSSLFTPAPHAQERW
jgi:hypothetical protein